MYYTQFKKSYKTELLPIAFNTVTLGNLMFLNLVERQPKSIISSTPSHVFSLFFYKAIVSKQVWKKALLDFAQKELFDTPLLNRRLVASPILIQSIKNDFLKLVLDNFKADISGIEVAFSRLEQQDMSTKYRKQIQKLMLLVAKDEDQAYHQKIGKVKMVTRLYYGNLCLITNKANAAEIHRLLLLHPVQPLYRYIEEDRYVFEFSFKENPFCMVLESPTDFLALKA